MKVKSLTFIAVMTALLCVLAPIAIPMEPVPISLATLMIYIIGAIFPLKKSLPIVAIYILLGAIGVPVFSAWSSGFGVILGPTGGYIIGYLVCVLVQGILVRKNEDNMPLQALAMIIGTILLYTFGTVWFMRVMTVRETPFTLEKALLACVLPFILGDTIKIFIATFASVKIRKALLNYKFI